MSTSSSSRVLDNPSLHNLGLLFQYVDIEITPNADGKPKKQFKHHPAYTPNYNHFEFKPGSIKHRMAVKNKTDFVGLDTRTIAQVDIDMEDGVDPITLKWLYDNCPYFLSITSRLPHFLLLLEEQPWSTGKEIDKKGNEKDVLVNTVTKVKHGSKTAADLLHGLWSFMRTDEALQEAQRAAELPTIKTCKELQTRLLIKSPLIEMCLPPVAAPLLLDAPNATAKVANATAEVVPPKSDEISLLIGEFKRVHVDADAGRTFKSMAYALKSHAGDTYKDVMKQCGAQSSYCKPDYDSWFERLWKFDANGQVAKPITVGSFYFHARALIGDKAYFKIKQTNFRPFDVGLEQHLALSFVDVLGCDWVRVSSKNHYFNGVVWVEDGDKDYVIQDYIKNKLYQFYHEQHMRLSRRLGDAEDEEARKKMTARIAIVSDAMSWCKTEKKRKVVIENINGDLHMRNLQNPVEFDANDLSFYFRDKCFDLVTGQQISPSREDYVTKTTTFKWCEPTPEQLAQFGEMMQQIFPVEEERNLYCKFLASALTGKQLDKFIVANGGGGNGKSVIHDLMENLCGEGSYCHRISESTLCNNKLDEKCVDLARLNGVRFAIAAEPPESTGGFQKSIITKLTGNSTINARLLYSNDTKVNIKSTLFVECNQKLPLLGRMDDAWARRIIDFPFRSTFAEHPEKFHGDYIFPVNKYYTTSDFRTEYRCVLFKYLLPHVKALADAAFDVSKFIPESIRERGAIYMEDSDPMKGWIDENYKRTGNPADYVKIADMFDFQGAGYKYSELYINLNKADKRKQNLKWFKAEIAGNMFVKRDYKEEHRPYANGTQIKARNVLVGWTPKSKAERFDDVEASDEESV